MHVQLAVIHELTLHPLFVDVTLLCEVVHTLLDVSTNYIWEAFYVCAELSCSTTLFSQVGLRETFLGILVGGTMCGRLWSVIICLAELSIKGSVN